jgi:hypothetical protein
LQQELSDEFTPVPDLEAKALKLGISRSALGRAASKIGARVKRVSSGGSSRLCWRMPAAENGAHAAAH